jgi:hypothetical protein
MRSSKYACTVLTQDGQLRREVTAIERGQIGRPDVFQGAASEDDVKHVRTLLSESDFRAATRNASAGLSMVSPTGRILAVEANLDGKLQSVVFADHTGTTPIPSYLLGVVSFAEDVKSRKLPKIKAKVDSMCRALSQRTQFP